MGSHDDLPKRPLAHDIESAAEDAFRGAIAKDLFVVQRATCSDYGVDFYLEARLGEKMTNLGVNVQVKGTDKKQHADGSVRISVSRPNLNYLHSQPYSFYVCFHRPTKRLLFRHSTDVHEEYEHRDSGWLEKSNVTIRFVQPFDTEAQQRIHSLVVASGREGRDRRRKFASAPPDEIPALLRKEAPDVVVPENADRARAILTECYRDGQDATISRAFNRFSAVLKMPGAMDLAYMAEINLGITGAEFDKQRVQDGIDALEASIARGENNQGALRYCIGNAWLALCEYQKALDQYRVALDTLDHMSGPQRNELVAQCSKNMGAAMAALGDTERARTLYERALELDADLPEARLALGQWHRRYGNDPRQALLHLDRVTPRRGSALQMETVIGWRVELLFKVDDSSSAFREIRTLLSSAEKSAWVWPYCARLVTEFGRSSVSAATDAVAFWRAYLREHSDAAVAERQRLLCLCFLRRKGAKTDADFAEFKLTALRLIGEGDPTPALLWDLVGHWAQCDGDWVQAEVAYREAFALEPEQYGYCLGTALNFLGRFAEALPILIAAAEVDIPDELSWFQVARAREGTGDLVGSIAAYQRAIALKENYELAWFNLGGVYWNADDSARASMTWREAVRRFPSHPLAQQVRDEYSFLLAKEIGEPSEKS